MENLIIMDQKLKEKDQLLLIILLFSFNIRKSTTVIIYVI